jgi:hypothetical protein
MIKVKINVNINGILHIINIIFLSIDDVHGLIFSNFSKYSSDNFAFFAPFFIISIYLNKGENYLLDGEL